ncbi:MAG: rhomboid family intramembrane serine protease, partial [Flavobacteriales bacterium]
MSAKKTVAKTNSGWRITYNAKLTLTFCLICVLLLNINEFTANAVNQHLSLTPYFKPLEFYRFFSYVLCHGSYEHLLGNLLFLIILGPILEEKYGSKPLLVMALITAVSTGIVNMIFFNSGIIGASGIVFMFIILSSIVNLRSKEIPLTFIFVVLIYLGGEILNSFKDDSISQFGH